MTEFRCRVILLDDTIIERDLEKKAVGQVLFDQVCEYLNLLERDYFGLAAWDSSNNKVWLNLNKKVHKQIISHDATFTFSVKFYPPDPSVLAEDITRYLLCLQLRIDILSSRLPCPSDMLAVLGSYTIQSEFGDYNPELHGKEFFSKIPLVPDQTPELEEKVAALHCTLKSMSPAQADRLFLQTVKRLDLYGVHLHPAKDVHGSDVMLRVCADGLMVYEDEEKTESLIWPRVLKLSYRHSNFHARILQSEDASEKNIKFILPSYRDCKCLWRNAVEHHAFFRLTHAESLEASTAIKRPVPPFSRSAIKRKVKESLIVASKRPNRTEFDEWFQVLGSDESWPAYGPDKDKLTDGVTLAYKEREEVGELDNEWFQLFGGRSFPTQHLLSSLSSDTDILESATFKHWKLQADDWFVLLEPHTYHPTFWPLKTLPLPLQPSQDEEHSEELEWIEESSGKTIKVVKIRKEAVTEQHEELEMERGLIGPDIVGENLELDIGASEKTMKVMREMIEREGDGEEIQTVVMYEQRTREVEPYSGQSQEAFVDQRMRRMEEVETIHESSQIVSEDNIEDLKETLLEVESIRQGLQDVERLKVNLQKVEILEQKLQELQQAGKRRGESDKWYILLEHKLMGSSTAKRHLGVETSEQKLQDIEQKRQQPEEEGDWYLLLDHKPLVVSSASSAGQKAEIRQWIEEELQRANTPVQMKDDWYILLDLLPRYTQTMQTASPPSEHKNLGEEQQWREERTVHVRETTLPTQREEQTQKQVDDDFFIQQDVSPKKTETREEEVQLVKKQVKTITSEEGRRKMIETSYEMLQTNEVPFEKRGVHLAGMPDTWILEKKRLREVQKGQPREDIKITHVVEDKRLHPYVPGPKAEEYQRVDDWFLLLEPVSKKSVNVDSRAEDDRHKKDVFKKQIMVEDRRKVAGFKPVSVPVIPVTPSDQPMTSTPTAQYVRMTGPTYQEESLKRLDITQEITQDIKQKSKVETESIVMRKKREKRIEGESIYIRHSILMLEDSDMTQEIMLKHHASISELKRNFMEDIPVYGPTEWDRRLSTYTPVVFPILSNGELFTDIDRMGADGLLAM